MAQQTLNSKAVSSIMKARINVTADRAGRSGVFTIQGNGNVIGVKNKAGEPVASYSDSDTQFEKKVFNCKANSAVAMANPRNHKILLAALKAEKAGTNVDYTLNEKEGAKSYSAHELFNAYLNKVQFSFNIPLPSAIADQIGDRDEISAKVQLIKTDNGEILTLDPKTIKVLEPEVFGTTEFKMPDLDAEDIDADDVFGDDEDDAFTAMDHNALVAEAKKAKIKGLTKASTDDDIRAALRAELAKA